MRGFRIDARFAAAAVVALGFAGAAPHWAAAQDAQGAPGGQDDCILWKQMEGAVRDVDLKAAIATERAIDLEMDCSRWAAAAKKAVLDVFRAQDSRMERQKASPRDRLAQLEASLKYANKWNAWDIHAKIAELQRKVPGGKDNAKISMAYDRALVAIDEMPEAQRPPASEIGKLSRLAYQFEALAVADGAPIKRDGGFTRSVRQITVGYVPAPLQFEFDKDELTPAGKAQVQNLLAQLKARNMPELQLVGHTDPVGSFEYNDDLSLRRAAAIKKFLTDNGYPANKITIAGRGKRDAATYKIEDRSSFTEAEIHQMLRRVELKFKD